MGLELRLCLLHLPASVNESATGINTSTTSSIRTARSYGELAVLLGLAVLVSVCTCTCSTR
jgi:hypothetical protein